MQNSLDDIDGALWGLIEENGNIECETTVYRFIEKKTPINEDLGSYRYHILTFKPNEPAGTIEFMKAYVGNVGMFIDNYAKAGYNGLMVKDGCVPKKTVKDIIRVTSKNLNIPEKSIKPILAKV